MTLPYERLRSLGWGSELLRSVAADVRVQGPERELAAELLGSYPAFESLVSLIGRNDEALPTDWAEAIEAAGALFRRLQFSEQGSEATRRDLVFTRRHFPLPGEARNMADGGHLLRLISWIAADRYRFLASLNGSCSDEA